MLPETLKMLLQTYESQWDKLVNPGKNLRRRKANDRVIQTCEGWLHLPEMDLLACASFIRAPVLSCFSCSAVGAVKSRAIGVAERQG